jgi:anti-sigma B factor antagonist
MRSFYIGEDETVDPGKRGEVAVLVVGGEIDYEASPQLRACIINAIKGGRRQLVLDLSAVTFVDSTAIGVMAGALARLEDAGGGSLAVVCTNDKVLQIFEITGLDSVITLHGSRDEALSAIATAG